MGQVETLPRVDEPTSISPPGLFDRGLDGNTIAVAQAAGREDVEAALGAARAARARFRETTAAERLEVCEHEAIEVANRSRYGLDSAVFSANLDDAWRAARRVHRAEDRGAAGVGGFDSKGGDEMSGDERIERQDAKEEVRRLEEDPPEDLEDWPGGTAKYETFGGPEGDSPYEESPAAKLGPSGVRHHEDGSVSVDGKKVDNPEDYKGDPIPGGPTDPDAMRRSGSDKDS